MSLQTSEISLFQTTWSNTLCVPTPQHLITANQDLSVSAHLHRLQIPTNPPSKRNRSIPWKITWEHWGNFIGKNIWGQLNYAHVRHFAGDARPHTYNNTILVLYQMLLVNPSQMCPRELQETDLKMNSNISSWGNPWLILLILMSIMCKYKYNICLFIILIKIFCRNTIWNKIKHNKQLLTLIYSKSKMQLSMG